MFIARLKTFLVVSSIALASAVSITPSQAADMIGYGTPQKHVTTRHPHVRYVKRQRYYAAPTVCSQVQIEYRVPHEPRTEIVDHCHTPVDLVPISPIRQRWS